MSIRTPSAYAAVAGLCILLHNAVMIAAERVALPLWTAVLLSFGIVAGAGYVLHGLFTFRQPLSLVAFAHYAIAMSANIPLAYLTTWFFLDRAGLPMTIAAPLGSVCMLAVNFVLGRWAITAPRRKMAANR